MMICSCHHCLLLQVLQHSNLLLMCYIPGIVDITNIFLSLCLLKAISSLRRIYVFSLRAPPNSKAFFTKSNCGTIYYKWSISWCVSDWNMIIGTLPPTTVSQWNSVKPMAVNYAACIYVHPCVCATTAAAKLAGPHVEELFYGWVPILFIPCMCMTTNTLVSDAITFLYSKFHRWRWYTKKHSNALTKGRKEENCRQVNIDLNNARFKILSKSAL